MLAYLTEKLILDNHILSGLPAAQSWRHPFGEKKKGEPLGSPSLAIVPLAMRLSVGFGSSASHRCRT